MLFEHRGIMSTRNLTLILRLQLTYLWKPQITKWSQCGFRWKIATFDLISFSDCWDIVEMSKSYYSWSRASPEQTWWHIKWSDVQWHTLELQPSSQELLFAWNVITQKNLTHSYTIIYETATRDYLNQPKTEQQPSKYLDCTECFMLSGVRGLP